ncbi:MAG: hypothetical protein K2N35_12000 [Muribaculaceae bacterium]|nr:hypothetical protein [Muribaculaceae bacterium]
MNSSTNRLLKNTGLLYFRLIFLTFINLYTVRVTLEALGTVDYGVYDVIASLVASLSILSGAMSSASQRFLSFHLGKGDFHKYSHTFTLLLIIFSIITIILILIGELLGYFFIEDWLTIPKDRLTAAKWVFQTSLVAFAAGLITIPYTASIVSNERMDAFAIFSIVEGVLKLLIAYMLVEYGGNRLILYGILTALTSIVVLSMSIFYCHSKFSYCKYIWKWDRNIFSDLSKYTGWNLFGSISGMLATQGQNILLNIYFGPVINAAKAIADRIRNVISGFSVNLYMAASPQIIKSYAAEDYDRAMNLVIKTSKMSFLLIFVLAFPLICNMPGLLAIWLGPDAHTPDMSAFSKLILLYCMLLALEPPITRIIQATGKIRNYQMSVGIITLSYIPIAAGVLALGGSPTMTLKVLIAIMTVAHVVRLIIAHRQVNLQYKPYFKYVILTIFKIGIIAIPIYVLFDNAYSNGGFLQVIGYTLLAGILGLIIVGVLGLDKSERIMIHAIIKQKLNRK